MTPVVDFVPPGIPPLLTDRMEAVVQQTREQGLGAAAWETMLDEQVRQLEDDPTFRERVHDVYREAGVDVIIATVGTTDPRRSFVEGTYYDLARWNARFDTVDWLQNVTTPSGARALNKDEVGVVLCTQNLGEFTRGDVTRAEALYNAGLRVMQPTYNKQNHMGAGCNEPADNGLSEHGKEVIEQFAGDVLFDLSHCNAATTRDTIETADSPVALTHTHCDALHDHPRATSDEVFTALADNNGYAGILVYPHHYEDPTFETFFEHFEHAASMLGHDRVGVATDWCITTPDVPPLLRPALVSFFERETTARGRSGGMGFTPERFDCGFDGIRMYGDRSSIREAFVERGYSSEEIDGFLGGNLLAVWERALS